MSLARAISRGPRLKARLGVNGSHKASRSLVWRARAAGSVMASGLTQQPGQSAALAGVELEIAQRAVMVDVSGLEALIDHREILVLGQGVVLVGIGGGELSAAHAAVQFLEVERAVMVGIELVEQIHGRLLGFAEIHRSVIVGIELTDER